MVVVIGDLLKALARSERSFAVRTPPLSDNAGLELVEL